MNSMASRRTPLERRDDRLVDNDDAFLRETEKTLIEKGPWIMQQKAGGPMQRVKPFTPEVRAEIDNDLTDRSIDFMRQQHAAGKPFFLYLPFSMGHAPNYPSKQFAGKSRIGNYGDKMMEGDYHVGRCSTRSRNSTLTTTPSWSFAPTTGRRAGYCVSLATWDPRHGQAGSLPRRTGRSDRRLDPNVLLHSLAGAHEARHYLLRHVLEMDFLPTFASILGAKLPTDRPIDGVDQTAVLLGNSEKGPASRCSPSSARIWWPRDGSNGASTSRTCS